MLRGSECDRRPLHLEAELPGFTKVNREGIRVTEGQTAVVHLKMSLDRRLRVEVVRFIEWCIPPGGLAGLWNDSAAVVRMRINRNRVVAQDFVEHTATVTELFKWPAQLSQTRTTLVFRQERFTSEGTYKVGQDLIVFLGLRDGRFYRISGWFGAFLVDGDRIQSVNPEVAPEGTSVDDFLAKLRALAKEGRH